MPSYRVTLVVGLLRPATDPAQVLPTAASAARERAKVEANDLAVVGGEARATVRYLADTDETAVDVAAAVAERVRGLAEVGAVRVTRRSGTRWVPVAAV